MPSHHHIVIISPVRDEERTLERTIACLTSQTVTPDRWVIVDDGSSDRTAEIAKSAAERYDWIRLVQRPDRGFRKLGGGVIDAFYDGLESIDIDYDFIAKMDVDLEFSPRYLELILTYFNSDPQLAAASGKVFRPEGNGLVEEFLIDEMVAGQFKLYRRSCFEKIGGFVREVMWDGIDFHKARMNGFRTRSIDHEELRIIHLRLMGSSDQNVYRGRIRWGRGQWYMGTNVQYILASGLWRMKEKPYIVGGLLIVAGYFMSAFEGAPRFEDQSFRRALRKWQNDRLLGVFRGKGFR